MKNIKKYILILMIFVIIFIILNFYNSNKNIFDDIIILGLWDEISKRNEYEITSQEAIEIDIFTTINNMYKKIAPGTRGSFVIKFKRPRNSNYTIKINEKTSKPKNLVFTLENKDYSTLKEMEGVINKKFINTEEIIINWQWKYYSNEKQDVQDTKDGEMAKTYIFQIEATIEQERTENEI